MAMMKPKAATATTVAPSSAAYQTQLQKDIANFKPKFNEYLSQKAQYEGKKSAYDSWAASEAAARQTYEQAKAAAEQMGGYSPRLAGDYQNWQNVLRQNPGSPGTFNVGAPAAPVGTRISGNALEFFDPSKYGLTGIYSALEQVKKEGEPSAINKTPRSSFDITQLYRNAADYQTIDLSKLGNVGGVLAAVSGAGTTGKTYIPKSALAALAKDYSAYGFGDINASITGENAWETMQSPLARVAKLPPEMKLTTPEDEAKKAAADKALADWSAQKAKWTTDVYDPYQAKLDQYNAQFTGQVSKDKPTGWQGGWPGLPSVWAPTGQKAYYVPTGFQGGDWYLQRSEGYEKLNPTGYGDWRYAWRNHSQYPDLMVRDPIFSQNPGAAPVFSTQQPEAYMGPSLEHVFAESIPQAATGSGGTTTNALGQLLRKTHGRQLSGVQSPAAQQALTQQLYGSGGLSSMGRLLQSGTNESLGSISNPMLRGMLSQQLYD